jgi:hypothetical protein
MTNPHPFPLKRNVANILPAPIIKQVGFHGDLLARFKVYVRPELLDSFDADSRIPYVGLELGLVIPNAFQYPFGQRRLRFGIGNSVDADPLPIRFPSEFPKVFNDEFPVHVIHVAHERVGEIVCDGF